jgi:hypothetical protein
MKRLVLKASKAKKDMPKQVSPRAALGSSIIEEETIQPFDPVLDALREKRRALLDQFIMNLHERRVDPREFETVLKRFSKEELSQAISEIVDAELSTLETQLQKDAN